MALFNKKDTRLPDLPNPPSKFSDISKTDFEEDFPSYTPSINFDNHEMEERPRQKVAPIASPQFPRETPNQIHNEDFEGSFGRKPLFIKIDKYEEALALLNSVKERLSEADKIINELRQIRKDEDSQLEEWSDHIASIKDKLMSVDNNLFE